VGRDYAQVRHGDVHLAPPNLNQRNDFEYLRNQMESSRRFLFPPKSVDEDIPSNCPPLNEIDALLADLDDYPSPGHDYAAD
jgi:hypothetical protein